MCLLRSRNSYVLCVELFALGGFVVLAMSSQAEGLRMGGVGRRGLGGTSSPRKSAPRASARKRAFYARRQPEGLARVRSLFLPKRVAKRRATASQRGIAIL